MLNIYGVTQRVTEFTRITENSSSLVDYVLTNFDELDVMVRHIPKMTDHSVISVNFCNKAFLWTNIAKPFRNFSTLKMHDINLELINTDFLLNSTDVNILYDNIHIICETVINNISPIQTYSIREDSVPWYDFEIKNKSKQRDVTQPHKKKFLTFRSHYVSYMFLGVFYILKPWGVKKQQYYYKKIDTYKHNSDKMWKTLKTLINTKISIQFDIEGDIKEIKDCTNIAEQFNVYFIESIKDIINNIDTVHNWNDIDINVNIQNKFDEFKLINLCDLSPIFGLLKHPQKMIINLLNSPFLNFMPLRASSNANKN
ncbi:hypothetical protein NQ318_005211 [Aromia moschata]|uniref:Uncharacterized protein n=1 Tax=Aromia moschata TaxID=1265417 RepID=A0AAV8XJ63_9CUCU|nr:hypothetical protein NQ318_005211 [Aromia moschata]